MKNEISIIVPVYNVEKYIKRCLNSIISQTINNFEVILIDDGSTDKSLDIIKEYEKKYDFIKVYTQKNSGPAIARNKGIKKSKQKYVMFIDSDDYIDNDYIETYYNTINHTDYDIVMGGFQKTDGVNTSFVRKLKEGKFSKYVVTGPVAKIYRRDFLIKNKVTFLDTNSSEDVYFNLLAINRGAKIKIIDNIGYYYFDNMHSISNTKHKGFNQKVKITELLSSINFPNSIDKELNDYYIIRYCIWYLLYSGKNSTTNSFMSEYQKLFNWLKENIPNYKKNSNIKINGPEGEIKKIGNIIFIFMGLHKLRLIKLFSKLYCK